MCRFDDGRCFVNPSWLVMFLSKALVAQRILEILIRILNMVVFGLLAYRFCVGT